MGTADMCESTLRDIKNRMFGRKCGAEWINEQNAVEICIMRNQEP
jgi:hypothetical protein